MLSKMKVPLFLVTVLLALFSASTADSQCLKSNRFTITIPVSVFNGSLEAGDCTIAQFGLDPSDISFADQWVVTVPSSGTLTIRMETTAFDAFLWLFGSTVNQANFIASDDDSGGNLNSLISVSMAAGTYIILANSAFPNVQDTGPYTLTITFSGSLSPLPQFTLTVNLAGNGTGIVTSNPAGINCPPDCSESYASGTGVTLTRTVDSGSTFGVWSGCDSLLGDLCGVGMDASKTVTATFNLPVAGLVGERLSNISTRARVLTGDNVMIGGFIIEGSA